MVVGCRGRRRGAAAMERSQVDTYEGVGVDPPGEPASFTAILLSIIFLLPG